MILDGIDELAKTHAQRLLELLRNVRRSPKIKLLLLCQDEVFIRNAIVNHLSFGEALVDITNCTGTDIEDFISTKTAVLVGNHTNLKAFERLIVHTIREKSRGMFQWVSLMVGMVESYGQDSNDVKRVLEEFPPGLDPAYIKVLKRISEKPAFVVRRAQLALGWLVCAIEPLTTRQLRTAIWLKEEDFNPLGDDEMTSEVELELFFTNLLGPLVDIDQSQIHQQTDTGDQAVSFDLRHGRRIRLCHYSLRQLLTGPLETVEAEAKAMHSLFHVEETEAHYIATKTCLTQLSRDAFDDFISTYYDIVLDPHLLHYAGLFWNKHGEKCPDAWIKDSGLIQSLHNLFTTSLSMSVDFLGQLSVDLAARKPVGVDSMEKLLAFKQAQDAILPASRATEAYRRRFPSPVEYVAIVQKATNILHDSQPQQFPDIARWDLLPLLQKSLWQKFSALRPKETPDSILMQDLRNLLTQFPKVAQMIQPSFDLLAELSESLRGVCITISVNPVRDWLYDFGAVPEQGVFANAVPLLTYSSFITEFLMALPFLSKICPDDLEFGSQYLCTKPHRYYGPLTLTALELAIRKAELPSGFNWEESVDRHRRILYHRWIHLWFYLALFSQRRGMLSLMTNWTTNYWLQDTFHLPLMRHSRLRNPVLLLHTNGMRTLSTSFNFVVALRALPGVFLLYVGRVINRCVGPALWSLLLWQAQRLRMAKQNCDGVVILFRSIGTIGTCVGFALYCLRWRYWPSFGAHMCPHPLDDIQAIIANPLEWNVGRFGWRKIVTYYIGYALLQATYVGAFAVTQFNPGQRKTSIPTLACHFFVAFYYFTLLERTFHMVANTFVTVFSLIVLVFYKATWMGKWSLGLWPYLSGPFVIASVMTILVLSAMSFVLGLLIDPFELGKTEINLHAAQVTIRKLNGKSYIRRAITSQGTQDPVAIGHSAPLRPTNAPVSPPSRGKFKLE
jgi:hypothetical protein